MKCKLCGGEFDKLAKSHVIPKWCSAEISTDQSPLVEVNKWGTPPKKRRTGHFDPNILCHSCEKKFGRIDDRAAKLFCETKPLTQHSRYLEFDEKHKRTALLFVQSMLLRASLSDMDYFSKVSLGPYEQPFAKSLETEAPHPNTQGFIFKMARSGILEQGLGFEPQKYRQNGKRGYRFYFGHYQTFIRFEHSTPLISNNTFELSSSGNLIIGIQDYFDDELESIKRFIATHRSMPYAKKRRKK